MAYAFTHRHEYLSPTPGAGVAQLRAEATAVLQALFSTSSGRTAGAVAAAAPAPASAQPLLPGFIPLETPPVLDAFLPPPLPSPPLGVQAAGSGGLPMVDDDMLPGHATAASARGAWAGGAPNMGGANYAAAATVNTFPTLQPAGPNRTAIDAPCPPQREVAPAMPPMPPADASAFSRGLGVSRGLGDGPSFPPAASAAYSAEALEVARAQPQWVRSVELHLEAFLAGDARRESLPPMGRPQRAVVHELAKSYGIATAEYDDEPRRHVDLFRAAQPVGTCTRLSDFARAVSEGMLPPPALSAGAIGGGADEWPVELVDVACSEAGMATTLRQLHGDFAVRARPGRPLEGTLPSVTLAFAAEGAARSALEVLGGGVRGAFRVLPPPWLSARPNPPHTGLPPPPGRDGLPPPGLPPPPAAEPEEEEDLPLMGLPPPPNRAAATSRPEGLPPPPGGGGAAPPPGLSLPSPIPPVQTSAPPVESSGPVGWAAIAAKSAAPTPVAASAHVGWGDDDDGPLPAGLPAPPSSTQPSPAVGGKGGDPREERPGKAGANLKGPQDWGMLRGRGDSGRDEERRPHSAQEPRRRSGEGEFGAEGSPGHEDRRPLSGRADGRAGKGGPREFGEMGRGGGREAAAAAAAAGDDRFGGGATDADMVSKLQALGFPLIAARRAAREARGETRTARFDSAVGWLQERVDKGELSAPRPPEPKKPEPAAPEPPRVVVPEPPAEVAKAKPRVPVAPPAKKAVATGPPRNAFAMLMDDEDDDDDDDDDESESESESEGEEEDESEGEEEEEEEDEEEDEEDAEALLQAAEEEERKESAAAAAPSAQAA